MPSSAAALSAGAFMAAVFFAGNLQSHTYLPLFVGALVAVTMQTAYLSPPVAMSAYYLKQVVKEWSLGGEGGEEE